MYLRELVAGQKRGEACGIASVCSAHPLVIEQVLEMSEQPLIEATCNQVNQFGGYTGMTPRDFVAFVHGIAREHLIPVEHIQLGGDHLGPHVWKGEPATEAMAKAGTMVAAYARAGFAKLHLDCSMRLADDVAGPLDKELAASRAAELAAVAEHATPGMICYVIGTEVPQPGGATAHEEGVAVTAVDDVRETIEMHRREFRRRGLDAAWERVIAVVVQPGLEFGDDFVLPYRPEAAQALSRFIEAQPMIYEAHSTDYQTQPALKSLVRDHFAVLKVGPALTFAYREAVFALAMIENEWLPADERSNFMEVLDGTMTAQPQHWKEYYRGTGREQAFKRKFSLSDRARYYWARPEVRHALEKLLRNLGHEPLPYSLCSQFVGEPGLTAQQVLKRKVRKVMNDYLVACLGNR